MSAATLAEAIGREHGEYLSVMNRNAAATITLHRPMKGRRFYVVDGRYLERRTFTSRLAALEYALSGLSDEAAGREVET